MACSQETRWKKTVVVGSCFYRQKVSAVSDGK